MECLPILVSRGSTTDPSRVQPPRVELWRSHINQTFNLSERKTAPLCLVEPLPQPHWCRTTPLRWRFVYCDVGVGAIISASSCWMLKRENHGNGGKSKMFRINNPPAPIRPGVNDDFDQRDSTPNSCASSEQSNVALTTTKMTAWFNESESRNVSGCGARTSRGQAVPGRKLVENLQPGSKSEHLAASKLFISRSWLLALVVGVPELNSPPRRLLEDWSLNRRVCRRIQVSQREPTFLLYSCLEFSFSCCSPLLLSSPAFFSPPPPPPPPDLALFFSSKASPFFLFLHVSHSLSINSSIYLSIPGRMFLSITLKTHAIRDRLG